MPSLLRNKDGELPGSSLDKRSLAQSWLFPDSSDYLTNLPEYNEPARIPSQMDWIDANLNEQQIVSMSRLRCAYP